MIYNAAIFAFSLWNMASGQNNCMPKDCYDLRCYGLSKGIDGPHTIYPERPSLPSLEVSCDQDTNGGGWIMYQRRVNGTLNFTRTWAEYKILFGKNGDNTTELWLGNEHVYQLLQSFGGRKVTLRIEVDAFDGDSGWIEATDFTMGDVSAEYIIYWNNLTTTASPKPMAHSWNNHNNQSFKTYDFDGGDPRCLTYATGGWWYGRTVCTNVYLNGNYSDNVRPGIYVPVFKPVGLRQSRMMFRTTDVHACDNPCKNGGTCEYDETTTTITCNCSAEFSGPLCDGEESTTLPSTPTSIGILPIVAGILLLLILTGLGITAFVIYKRRQKQREEEEAAANRMLPLVDFLTDQGYQDYMLGFFGF